MIVEYETGDLVQLFREGDIEFMAHGCNCFHRMKSGIAAQISHFWPIVAEIDKGYTECGDSHKLGTAQAIPVDRGDGFIGVIYNCYTQYRYGTDKMQVEYAAVEEAFRFLNFQVPKTSPLGIPRIGCGLAGGDWSVVEEIINDNTPDLDVIVLDLP